MTAADRMVKLISQLAGDIAAVDGITVAKEAEPQLLQLLTDAAEEIGHIAIGELVTMSASPRQESGAESLAEEVEANTKACGCGPGESCHDCLPLPGRITF